MKQQSMNMHQTPDNRKNQRGIGLVEILVAVVIVSIGFLAAATMQVQGMRFSQGAYFRSQAYFVASDMIDRMRNNPVAVSDGFYSAKVTSAGLSNPNCNSSNCNPETVADQDLFDWSATLHNLNGTNNFIPLLPSSDTVQARGEITQTSLNEYRLTMYWAETNSGNSEEQSLVVNFATEESL